VERERVGFAAAAVARRGWERRAKVAKRGKRMVVVV
jgi:hypothetical protein